MSEEERQSELSALREALGQAQLKAEAFTHLSHEIRTLLSGVIGITQLLLDTDLSTEQRDYAKRIRTSGDALLGLLNNVLDFSRVEAREAPPEAVDFDLRKTLDEVGELLAERAADKGIELVVVVPPTVPAAVRGDPAMLRQVLLNLVSNAIKFTERGEVVLRVVGIDEDRQGVTGRFEVSDTGVGISEAGQARLFQPFSQVHDPSLAQGGSGLGLALVKRLVEAMHGSVGVRSELGRGTTFHVSVRFERRSATADRSAIPRVDVQGRRVLVATPSEASRANLEEMMSDLRVDCASASDAATALWMLREGVKRQSPIEVFLVDAALPDLVSGPLGKALAEDERFASTQVVLMSYPGQRVELRRTRDSESPSSRGGLAHRPRERTALAKPVRKTQLHACLLRLMGSSMERVEAVRDPESAHSSVSMRKRDAAALGLRWPERRTPDHGRRAEAIWGTPAEPTRATVASERERARAVAEAVGRGEATWALSPARPRILLVEDNAVNQRIAVVMAQKRGYEVDIAQNGLEAVAAVAKTTYLAVLMDCQMPKLDGYGATSQIRANEGHGRRLPIIAMTANSGPGAKEKCLASGMDDFISKPIMAEDLDRVLRRWAPLTGGSGQGAGVTPLPPRVATPPPDAPPSERAGPPPGRISVIDRTMLSKLRAVRQEGEPDLALEVIELFLAESLDRLALLRRAVEQGDLTLLAQVAHTLKGSAGQLGAKSLTTLCRRLEDKARTGAPFNGVYAVAAIEEELGRVRDALGVEARRIRSGERRASSLPPVEPAGPPSRPPRREG